MAKKMIARAKADDYMLSPWMAASYPAVLLKPRSVPALAGFSFWDCDAAPVIAGNENQGDQ
ncbi:hypothetical protein [Bradyrhizobium sp.]|uniref:hypothetical protein n=1 Tax=Bradyrhizobium sp. TaxID=376 RepID=UPI002D7E3B8E|nr:hypothetical protein [Bradyrhizobium sp.]